MESTGLSSRRFNPSDLRILVVDDDPACLKALENMLIKCKHQVTTCSLAQEALDLLEKRRGGFDLVISELKVADMDGFMFVEQVCNKMDLPVIMMSADGETSRVMKGVQHGACYYLLKPIRMKDIRNIWLHVFMKRLRNEGKESLDQTLISGCGIDSSDDSCSISGDLVAGKKRKEVSHHPSSIKKPRVVWTSDLHHKFVKAVNRIGLDKVGPKKILESMVVPWLTRENVASHLQKYRLYLSRKQKQNDLKAARGGMKPSDISSSENTCPQSGVSPSPSPSLTLQQNIVINENYAPRNEFHIHSHGASICEGNVAGIQSLPKQGELHIHSHRASICEGNVAGIQSLPKQGEVEKGMYGVVAADAPISSSAIIAYNQHQHQQQQQPFELIDLEAKQAHYSRSGGGAPSHQQFKQQHIKPHFQFEHYPLVSHPHGLSRREADHQPTQANINYLYSKNRSYAIGTENTDTATFLSIPQQTHLTNCHTFEQVPCFSWSTKSHDVEQQSHLHNNLESSLSNMTVGTGSALRLHDMEFNAYSPAGSDIYQPSPHLVNMDSFGCSSNQEDLVGDATPTPTPELFDPHNFDDEYDGTMDYFQE